MYIKYTDICTYRMLNTFIHYEKEVRIENLKVDTNLDAC